jgi:hypothetical protein
MNILTNTERPPLLTTALKTGPQMADNFMDRCLKFKHDLEAACIRRKKQLKTTALSLLSVPLS